MAPVAVRQRLGVVEPLVVEGIGMQMLAGIAQPKYSGQARDWVGLSMSGRNMPS